MKRTKRQSSKTLLFTGHDFKFLQPIMAHYQSHPENRVLIDEHSGHVVTDTAKSQSLLEQADIVFCEWCLGNAEWYSKNKRQGQFLIIRLHHQEIQQNLPYLQNIKWDNVDRIVFICQNNMRRFLDKFPFMQEKAILIYNPIDSLAFDIPKLYGAEFNLGFMGTAPKRKAPHLAFEILKHLKETDSRYTLFIKGKQPWEYDWLWQSSEERSYFEQLYSDINSSKYAHSVVFDPHGNDVPDWFSKIGFLLSTSDHEGSHQSVAEGMASGAIPVIRNWQGADQLYPKEFVFKTIDEAVQLILKWNTTRNYAIQYNAVKEYAQQHFEQNVVIPQYDDLIKVLQTGDTHSISTQEAVSLKTENGNIVVMHVCYLDPENQTGYETRVVEETRLLHTLGIQVIIACFVKGNQSLRGKTRRLSRRLRHSTGAKVYIIPTDHYFDLSVPPEGITTITRALVSLARQHDVNIMHGQALYSTMHILRANRRTQAKVVFDVHGASPEENEMAGGHPNRINRLEEWEKEALHAADLRIFVSYRMKDFFKNKYSLSDQPHTIIPCCVHKKRFHMHHDVRRSKRKKMGIDGKFVFLYLGTLSVWQWPEAMFSLFSQFRNKNPDSIFFLLLPRSDHHRATAFLKKHGLPSDCYIIDEVPHDEVGSVIGVADVGFLLRKSHPVNYVSSPTKFGEYLAAGVPVIATHNIGDTSDLIEKNNVGLLISVTDEGVKPDQLKRIALFTQDVQKNRQVWADRCMNLSSTNLAWEANVNLLGKAYEAIA